MSDVMLDYIGATWPIRQLAREFGSPIARAGAADAPLRRRASAILWRAIFYARPP